LLVAAAAVGCGAVAAVNVCQLNLENDVAVYEEALKERVSNYHSQEDNINMV
jgi:hypothetical protein